MEKISRIIPSSPRLQAVDMKKERPVRASAPGYGAPVAASTNRGPVKHAVVEATKAYRETYGPDAKLAREADMVKRMGEEFFLNQAKHSESTPPETQVAELIEAEGPIEMIDTNVQQVPNGEAEANAPTSISVRA